MVEALKSGAKTFINSAQVARWCIIALLSLLGWNSVRFIGKLDNHGEKMEDLTERVIILEENQTKMGADYIIRVDGDSASAWVRFMQDQINEKKKQQKP